MSTQKTSLYGIAVLVAIMSSTAIAQNKKPTTAAPAGAAAQPAKADDKVDISDLENKYWAPKDTDFSVVQNRTYSKQGRFFFTPQWGRLINDPYSEGNIMGVTGNYFWSERWGAEVTYLSADMSNNDATNDLAAFGSGVQPDHGKLAGYYGVGLNIVPFYAKMSLWGSKILYFDMAFTPTLGMTQYEQQIEGANKTKSSLTYGLDVTQYFFFANWFAVRADLKNQWHTEEVVRFRTSGGIPKGGKVTDKSIHNTLFMIGISLYY